MKAIIAGAFLSLLLANLHQCIGVKLRGFDDLSGVGDAPGLNSIGAEESVFLAGSAPRKYCDASYVHCQAFCGALGERELRECAKTAGPDECETQKRYVGLMCRKGCARAVRLCRRDVEAVTDEEGKADWGLLGYGARQARDGPEEAFGEVDSDFEEGGDESAEKEEMDFEDLVAGLESEDE